MSNPKLAKTGDYNRARRNTAYVVLGILTVLCLIWFFLLIMVCSKPHAELTGKFNFGFGRYLITNYNSSINSSQNIFRGMANSFFVSGMSALLTVYFSTLTAYALVVYKWKLRDGFFTFIMAVMMIPTQVVGIGFYQFMYKIHMTNNFLPLILPAIAAPGVVFFMRQFMLPSLHIDIINSARIDGAKEFYTFNTIVLPIMKPAIATQAIFAFVNSWNNLFLPMILLTDKEKYTMPIMVSLLKGDIYKTEFGSIYLGLTLTVLPLFIVYFLLSKYIIAGVALGGVKG